MPTPHMTTTTIIIKHSKKHKTIILIGIWQSKKSTFKLKVNFLDFQSAQKLKVSFLELKSNKKLKVSFLEIKSEFI